MADALFNSGTIQCERKNYPEALKNFRMFVEISPFDERIISAKILINYCLTEAGRPADIRVLVLANVPDVLISSHSRIECVDQTHKNEINMADIQPGVMSGTVCNLV